MFTKVQLTVQINAQVFLKLYLLKRDIIKDQWRVPSLFNFTRKKITSCVSLLDQSLKSVPIDSPKHLFCLSHYSN